MIQYTIYRRGFAVLYWPIFHAVYFGNFNLELRYCGIFQTCGMRFLSVLVDSSRHKNVSFTFSLPFLAFSGRFGSNLKQPYFVTHFNLQFDCFNSQFKAVIVPRLVFASIFCPRVNDSASYTGLL